MMPPLDRPCPPPRYLITSSKSAEACLSRSEKYCFGVVIVYAIVL